MELKTVVIIFLATGSIVCQGITIWNLWSLFKKREDGKSLFEKMMFYQRRK